MFYGLASGSVDTGGIEVDQVLSDIETLNRAAFEGKYEVTAVSFHAYAHLLDKYALLPHGASMGDNYGPIVVAPENGVREVKGRKIAIPGLLTTAYLALQLYEKDFEPVVVPFDQIEQFVMDGNADAGLLIHEGQLTYGDNGLRKIVDLGEWWAHRWSAAAAWRQHHPPRSRSRDDPENLEAVARQHRLRVGAPHRRGGVRAAIRARSRQRQDG
jgi:1,4-dihydroxy-6-naphthoate synthase